MSRRRVVVTGLGLISPVGNTVAEGWANLVAGRTGIDFITKFDASNFACRFAGEVKGFQVEDYIPAKEARHMDSFIHFGMAAAMQAVQDAGLPHGDALGLLFVQGIVGGQAGVADCLDRRRHPVVDEGVHVAGVLGREVVLDLETLHFASEPAGQCRGIEFRDLPNAAAPAEQVRPAFGNRVAHRAHVPEAGHDNASPVHAITSTASSPMRGAQAAFWCLTA